MPGQIQHEPIPYIHPWRRTDTQIWHRQQMGRGLPRPKLLASLIHRSIHIGLVLRTCRAGTCPVWPIQNAPSLKHDQTAFAPGISKEAVRCHEHLPVEILRRKKMKCAPAHCYVNDCSACACLSPAKLRGSNGPIPPALGLENTYSNM